jgi:hypothetical protein
MKRVLKMVGGFVISASMAISSQALGATSIYFSEVGTINNGVSLSNPSLGTGANSLYIWVTPDGTQGLLGANLNVVSSNPSAVTFTGVQVFNPNIVSLALGGADINDRWQGTGIGTNNGSSILGFSGVRVNQGTGIDPTNNGTVAPFLALDQLRDPVTGSFLFARIDFSASAPADLFMQIGTNGISPLVGSSSDVNIAFGANETLILNASVAGRNLSSNIPDASIVPEPTAIALSGMGLIGLAAFARRQRSRLHGDLA